MQSSASLCANVCLLVLQFIFILELSIWILSTVCEPMQQLRDGSRVVAWEHVRSYWQAAEIYIVILTSTVVTEFLKLWRLHHNFTLFQHMHCVHDTFYFESLVSTNTRFRRLCKVEKHKLRFPVGIALGYGLDDWGSRFWFPAGAANFSFHHCIQNGSGVHSASYPMDTSGSFPGSVKQPVREADHSPSPSAEVKEWVEL
jgi:hypothetical protein